MDNFKFYALTRFRLEISATDCLCIESPFKSPSELEQAALHWARQLTEEALQQEVQKLIDHCRAVIDNHGDYVP